MVEYLHQLFDFGTKSNYYNQIMQRYKNSIAGQFFGHSHKVSIIVYFIYFPFGEVAGIHISTPLGQSQDQFEIAYSDYSNQTAATAMGFASISPALTPTSLSLAYLSYTILTNQAVEGGNPAFKMYDVDPDTFEIMDVKVYTSKIAGYFSMRKTLIWDLANMSDLGFQINRKQSYHMF
jgi:sphingomyelin phosphodiesterase